VGMEMKFITVSFSSVCYSCWHIAMSVYRRITVSASVNNPVADRSSFRSDTLLVWRESSVTDRQRTDAVDGGKAGFTSNATHATLRNRRNESNERNSRKNRTLQPIGTELPSFQLSSSC